MRSIATCIVGLTLAVNLGLRSTWAGPWGRASVRASFVAAMGYKYSFLSNRGVKPLASVTGIEAAFLSLVDRVGILFDPLQCVCYAVKHATEESP